MNVVTLCLAIAMILVGMKTNAQTFSDGDVTVTFVINAIHDSTLCGTMGDLSYAITVQNSFLGDSVQVRDMFSGGVIYEETNITGQNPWFLMTAGSMASGFVPDNNLVAGQAWFFGSTTKVISGTDTVLNINNVYSETVDNPCSYGTVTGRVYVDNNSDCSFDVSDVALNSILIRANAALNSPSQSEYNSNDFSDAAGLYTIEVQQSWMTDYTVYLPPLYQFIFPSSACSPTSYLLTTLPQTNVDFSLQCSNSVDVQCYVGTPPAARPAIPFILTPFVNNTGCDAASGTLTLVIDPNVTYDATQSIYPADAVNGDTLTWNYSNLSNLSNGAYWNSFISSIHLTPDTAINIGDTLCFHVYSNVPAADINAMNNDYSVCIPVVNSYDPNIKEVSPAGIGPSGLIPQSTTELTYTIHFQNTGTAPAFNVSVVDTFDSVFYPASLKIIGASHAMTPEWISNNAVRFNFNNINLPDSISNEPQSHGFVTFKIETINVFPIGTELTNTAHIYFDFNPAIVTNTTLNTIGEPNAIAIINTNDLVEIFPNPTDGMFYVSNKNASSQEYDVRVEDCLGRMVKMIRSKSTVQMIDVSSLANGIYTVTFESRETGFRVIEKLVKQ